jgi:hypothetical protein
VTARRNRKLKNFIELVNASCIQRNTDRLFKATVAIATLEHLLDDVLHAGVDFDTFFFGLNAAAQRRVFIDALRQQSVYVLILLRNVKVLSSIQSEAK